MERRAALAEAKAMNGPPPRTDAVARVEQETAAARIQQQRECRANKQKAGVSAASPG